jgi:hypothetical protein
MKKFLLILLAIVVIAAVAFLIYDEPLPEGIPGPKAEALTEKMLDAINDDAWEKIPYVSWSFRDAHHYVWDKKNHISQVKWEDYEAIIDLNTVTGRVKKGGELLSGEEADEAIQTGWAYWCNDSFWLNAPAKADDPGTSRKIVKDEDGKDQLLVQYKSGGVTPGDAYLWQLDENFRPVSYKMWVSIIPVGGMKATWDGWVEKDGAWLATKHELGPMEVSIGNLRVGNSPSDFGLETDYFKAVTPK